MPFEQPAVPPPDSKRDVFSVEACVQDVNRRFAKFLAEDFECLQEGGVPVELIRLFMELQLDVTPVDRRSRELAWLRHAFEERLASEPQPHTLRFAEAIELLRDLLGDPFPAIGLLEEIMRRSSTSSPSAASSIPRFPLPPPAPRGFDGFMDPMRDAEPMTERAVPTRPFVKPRADAPTIRPLRERSASKERQRLTPPPTWRPKHGLRAGSSSS